MFSAASLAGAFGNIQQQMTQFFTPSSAASAPQDGRTVTQAQPTEPRRPTRFADGDSYESDGPDDPGGTTQR